MTIKAHYDGRVFVPDSPVDLPVGHVVEIDVNGGQRPDAGKPKTPLSQLAEQLLSYPDNPDVPEDFSSQVDHYLYGTPKRHDSD